ncbi:MAG: hypothetical protein ABIE43_02680 [Patescibacteria group bacterium]
MIKILIKILYLILAAVFIVSLFKVKDFPPQDKIDPKLLNEPKQTETRREDFDFNYREKNYYVKPLAEYELWGLVVTHNNIGAWYNYYHDENSVNLKDLCVVWGPNIENGVYREKEISFKSGEWTCYSQWSGGLKETFYPNKLSNNHLLSSDKEIQDTIRSVNIGDQVYLKGALVDYREEGNEWYRMTSISRDDSNQNSRSGGACEVFFVDEIKILKSNQVYWHLTNRWSKRAILLLIILQFIIFIIKSKKQLFSK